MVILRGDGVFDSSLTPDDKSRLLVLVNEVLSLPQNWYSEGVKIITTGVNRYIPEAKSTNYINAVIALKNARRQGAMEFIYVDENQRLWEGTTTNVFFISNNLLVTPESGILPGIMRKVIFKICQGIYDLVPRAVSKDDIMHAEEVFLSASNKQIVPVVRVNENVIGDGRPGKVTSEVMRLFKDYTERWEKGAIADI